MSRPNSKGEVLGVLLLLAASLGAFGCAAEPIAVSSDNLQGKFYTRYNIKYQQEGPYKVTYHSNYLSHRQVIPFGSEVEVRRYTTERIDMMVNNWAVQMHRRDRTFPTEDSLIKEFVDKHFTRNKDDAFKAREKVSEKSRSGVEMGEAQYNMTKEEVLLAIGYPSHVNGVQPADTLSREQILAGNQWTYQNSFRWYWPWMPDQWILEFSQDGILANIVR